MVSKLTSSVKSAKGLWSAVPTTSSFFLRTLPSGLQHNYSSASSLGGSGTSTVTGCDSTLSLAVPQYYVWGSGTGVGKSLVSAGLSRQLLRSQADAHLRYLKPVQTGFPEDSDGELVSQLSGVRHVLGAHAAACADSAPAGAECGGAAVLARTEFAWRTAVSPHLAVELEGRPVAAGEVVAAVQRDLWSFAASAPAEAGGLGLVETAGGVASPAPCGRLQCDVLRPLRLPGLLVGDGRLGGISAAVTAAETLMLRGLDVDAVIILGDEQLHNTAAIRNALRTHQNAPLVISLPAPPDSEWGTDALKRWSDSESSQEVFGTLLETMSARHVARQEALASAPARTCSSLWWPFTQHSIIPEHQVTVIDSRYGEHFTVVQKGEDASSSSSPSPPLALMPSFDACASWWTQGVSGQLAADMTRATAYAAGRYGHVMFPENCHEPALRVAELMLEGAGRGWAHRCFFSDNGSTAVEVGIKMGLKKYIHDHGLALREGALPQLKIIGLDGCYHGDTLGAMDCQGPSPFTGELQFPWYSGRGLWLQPPTLGMHKGQWTVTLPSGIPAADLDTRLESLEAIFEPGRDGSELAAAYRRRIVADLDAAGERGRAQAVEYGALLLEPVIQGAGGMMFIDPLYQRQLAQECRARGIPVILDEVFTGVWRLGRESASHLLHVEPDIACYAKLVTGGLIPLAVTLASEAVFSAFQGPTKLEALLHGHSYTAHPLGCAAGVEALALYKDPLRNPNYCPPAETGADVGSVGALREQWRTDLVTRISHLAAVERVYAIGTVFVCTLKEAEGQGGYTSTITRDLVLKLRREGVYARPLGNVLYLMCTPTTPEDMCTDLLNHVIEHLSHM